LKERLKNIAGHVTTKRRVVAICTVLLITGTLAFSLANISQGAPAEGMLADSNIQAAAPNPAAAEKKDFAGQTLTISYIWDYKDMPRLAKMYMAANPGVTIETNSFHDDYNLYEEQVTARLMAGTADDLLDNWRIHYRDSETNSKLADWFPIMRADPNFNENDYYMNVFKAASVDSRLFAYPMAFCYDMVAANNEIPGLAEMLSQHGTVSIEDLMGMYQSIPTEGTYFLHNNFDEMLAAYWDMDSFLNYEDKTVNFDSPMFVEYLKEYKAVSDPARDFWMYDSPPMYEPAILDEDSQKYLFCDFMPTTYQFLIPFEGQLPFSGHVPLTNDKGQLLIKVNDYDSYVLNGHTAPQTQELAWDFIKFMQDPANCDINSSCPAIMAPVYKPLLRYQLESVIPTCLSYCKYTFGWQSTLGRDQAVDSVFETLDQIYQMPMSNMYIYLSTDAISQIIQDDIGKFHNGQMTAEQTAADLQNRVSLALKAS